MQRTHKIPTKMEILCVLALAALILLLFFGANRRTEIPFGPFLAAGLIFALLFPSAASLTLFQAL